MRNHQHCRCLQESEAAARGNRSRSGISLQRGGIVWLLELSRGWAVLRRMQKRTISTHQSQRGREPDWLSLEAFADVEITSENPAHPIDDALMGSGSGWRAETPGPQTIRIGFNPARTLHHVRIVTEERTRSRTQEFVLRAALPDGSWREIARQQFNFSPSGATRQEEDYRVNVPPVTTLELTIIPDISDRNAYASVRQLRIAG